MFIADSRGVFTFCEVKNGQMVMRKEVNQEDAAKIIIENNLVAVQDTVFRNCKTYRTESSNILVSEILRTSMQ